MSNKNVITVVLDGESYLMPVKRKYLHNWGVTDVLPCLHCGSKDTWQVIRFDQLRLFTEAQDLYVSIWVCPDCQSASEYHLTV